MAVLAFAASQGPSTFADAGTPPSIVVMAKALDDLISLDPAEAFELSGAEIVANLYQRLFEPNPDNPAEPVPALVERWRLDPDGRRYLFTLRQGVRFASGAPVRAEDAVFSLARVVRLNKTPAFLLTQLGLSAETVDQRLQVIDDRQFALTTDRDYAPSFVLNVLSAGVASVVEKRAALAHARSGDLGHSWLRRNAAGAGAFGLRAWKPGEYVMLDSNPSYWRGAPILARVILRDIREPATQRLMLERGDIDIARNLAADQIAALADNPDLQIWRIERARLTYLGLNQRHPALAEPLVRRAMRYLIDYQGIAERLLKGRARVHQSFLPAGLAGALDQTPFAPDLAQARALLAEAGWQNGFRASLDLRADAQTLLVAQALQASMAEAGIALEIVPGEGKQTLTRYRARHHDIVLGQWDPDYLDPHSNAAAFARNPDNRDDGADKTLAWRNAWAIPEITAITDRALLERDPAKRAALYRDLQEILQGDSPFIILFQDFELIAARRTVEGFRAGVSADQTYYRGLSKQAAASDRQ